jgi:hypothetical protein
LWEAFDTASLDGEPAGRRRSRREEAVAQLGRNVAQARDAISGTDDAEPIVPWSLKSHDLITGGSSRSTPDEVALPGIYEPTAR